MSTSLLWAGVVTIALLGAGVPRPHFKQKAPREHLIDLTEAPPARTTAADPSINQLTVQAPVGRVLDSPIKHTPPIRVSAPDLDRPDYRIGDPVEFEVVFRNVSDRPIAFPTMLDGADVDRNMAGAAIAAIALVFQDQILGVQTFSPQFLYGANEIAGSLLMVQPGESVRIRARGSWILLAATGTPHEPHWPRPLKVKASLMLVANGVLRIAEHSNGVTAVQFGTRQK